MSITNASDCDRSGPAIGPSVRPAARRRRGSSLVEVQVSFAVLGIGLMGLCQLVVIQLRQVRVLERRLQGQVVQTYVGRGTSQTMITGNTYYLVPWANGLTRKLSGAAQISGSTAIPCDPGPLTVPPLATPFQVAVVELDAPAGGDSPTAYVDVSAP